MGSDAYARIVPKLFEHMRAAMGDEVEFLHDIHERVPPITAIRIAKEVEPYRLFFLEDPFAPEDIAISYCCGSISGGADRDG
ncbi:MAG: enolase C-terminal domain-like protein [Thermomicrobiales bacterium]